MYTISKIVYYKASEMHIPYLVYVVIEGPKGGRYMLDEFNVERLTEQVTGRPGISANMLIKQLHRSATGIRQKTSIEINSLNETMSSIAKKIKCTPVLRKQGISKTTQIVKNMCDKDKKNIIEAVNDIYNNCLK